MAKPKALPPGVRIKGNAVYVRFTWNKSNGRNGSTAMHCRPPLHELQKFTASSNRRSVSEPSIWRSTAATSLSLPTLPLSVKTRTS